MGGLCGVEFLNKTTESSQDFEKDWFILIIQNSQKSVEAIINEAIENIAKIDLVSNLLFKIPNWQKFDFLDQLLRQLNEKFKNVQKMIINISNEDEQVAQEAFELLTKIMLESDQEKSLKCLEIMAKMKLKLSQDNLERLLKINSLIQSQCSKSILDGQVQAQLRKMIDIHQEISLDQLIFSLDLVNLWDDFDTIEILDKIIVLDQFVQDKEFLLNQLSQTLSQKSPSENLQEIHDKVVMILINNPNHQGLQNCQTQLLAKILQNEHVDFQHLLSVIALMPNCEARNLSLTKLKMMIDLSE